MDEEEMDISLDIEAQHDANYISNNEHQHPKGHRV